MVYNPDILLLTIDALRADHLSCYGHSRDTPFFESLLDMSIGYNKAFSVSSHTREAIPPLLSGYRPYRFVSNGFTQVPASKTVAGRLRTSSYETAGFHSNPYLSRAYEFDAGFDAFYDDLIAGQNKFVALAQQALNRFIFNRGEYYARAPEINRRALDWLDERDGPVFLWNHYMDTHGPYHSPERHYADRVLSASEAENLYRRAWKKPGSITNEEGRLLQDSYDDEIRYLDAHLQSFFRELKTRGWMEDALIIVTADHGDGFGEHGYYAHPRYLHDVLLHVPLFVSLPGGSSRMVDHPVSTIDIVPTILESADIDHSNLPGKPLFDNGENGGIPLPEADAEFVFASVTAEGDVEGMRRFAIRDRQWKVTLERTKEGSITDRTAYNLETDLSEQEPLPTDTTDKTKDLTTRLKEFSRGRIGRPDEDPTRQMEFGDEIDDRLEALGYK